MNTPSAHQLLVHAFRLAFVLFAVCVIFTQQASASTVTTRSQVTYQLGALQGDRMIVANPGDQLTWIYSDRSIRAYDREGKRVVNRLHLTLPKGQTPVAMLANEQALWLAIDNQLIKFDLNGEMLLQKYFQKSIYSLSYDMKRSQLLVSTPRQVFILDHDGREIERIRATLPFIA